MKQTHTFIVVIFCLLMLSCSTTGHRNITIDAPSFAAVLVPEQLNTFLNHNDFYKVRFSTRVTEPNNGPVDPLNKKTGTVLSTENRLLMRYQHKTLSQLLINVRVNRNTGKIHLDFFEQDKKELSKEALTIYDQLKENLSLRLFNKNDFKER